MARRVPWKSRQGQAGVTKGVNTKRERETEVGLGGKHRPDLGQVPSMRGGPLGALGCCVL